MTLWCQILPSSLIQPFQGQDFAPGWGCSTTCRILPAGQFQPGAAGRCWWCHKPAGQIFPLQIEGKLFKSLTLLRNIPTIFPTLTNRVQFFPRVPQVMYKQCYFKSHINWLFKAWNAPFCSDLSLWHRQLSSRMGIYSSQDCWTISESS